MDYQYYLIIDIVIVFTALWALREWTTWSVFNPSLVYLAVHIYTVSLRGMQLYYSQRPLPSFPGALSMDSIGRAIAASDITLTAVVVASVLAANARKGGPTLLATRLRVGNPVHLLNRRVGHGIALVCLLFGSFCLLRFGAVATLQIAAGEDVNRLGLHVLENTTLPFILGLYAIEGPLIIMALYGVRRWTVLLYVALLIPTIYNVPRFASVLSIFLVFLMYMNERGRRSLSWRWVALAVPVFVGWFFLKPVAAGLAAGNDIETIASTVGQYFAASTGDNVSADMQFLDMQACNMSLIDDYGKYFYGATYLPLLTVPIPRYTWPDKPSLSQYYKEISTPDRPVGNTGMTPGITGEAYVNFGLWGCFVLPFMMYWQFSRVYRRIVWSTPLSPKAWLFIVFLVSSLLVIRDGLMSLAVYPFLYYLPLTAFGVVSQLWIPKRRARQLGGPPWPK